MVRAKKKNKYFVDTNYFIRFLIDDLPEQVDEVGKLFLQASAGKIDLYTSVLVFFEIKWILSSLYNFDKPKITKGLRELLSLDFVQLKERPLLEMSLGLYSGSNLSLEDCYHIIIAKKLHVNVMATFDKNLFSYFNKYE